MSFIHDNLAPLMFAGMIVFMLIGYPAAFSLAATGLFFGFIASSSASSVLPSRQSHHQLFGILSNDLLLAIPFFTFMGAILERCGLAEDMLDSFGQLFGPVRGGMSYAVIFVGAVLGAITGTVAASVIAMGVISMTPMIKYGYFTRHTMGVIAASGTITQLIPPTCPRCACRCARAIGWRYVCRRHRPEHHPGRSVLPLGCHRQCYLAQGRAGAPS
jgi:TRAP-type mannitol/chloroaromatic compound transport system permease large subunit